jgi:hypothetical protein
MRQLRMTTGLGIAGAKTSSWEQRPNFNLVGTSQTVVIHETPRATRMMCWLGSFPCKVYIDSSQHDTLGYEWPFVCCYHLIVCLVYY